MTARSLVLTSTELPEVSALIQTTFAYMEGRIDPSSSVKAMNVETIVDQARRGEIWVIGTPIQACIFLSPKEDCLYLGKLAVTKEAQGSGLARQLVSVAETRARARKLATLRLEARIELVENQAMFAHLGFVKVGETAHPGYDHSTSITFEKTLL
jgi:ribosomal protein S18 acetylase RimI-like enzyme